MYAAIAIVAGIFCVSKLTAANPVSQNFANKASSSIAAVQTLNSDKLSSHLSPSMPTCSEDWTTYYGTYCPSGGYVECYIPDGYHDSCDWFAMNVASPFDTDIRLWLYQDGRFWSASGGSRLFCIFEVGCVESEQEEKGIYAAPSLKRELKVDASILVSEHSSAPQSDLSVTMPTCSEDWTTYYDDYCPSGGVVECYIPDGYMDNCDWFAMNVANPFDTDIRLWLYQDGRFWSASGGSRLFCIFEVGCVESGKGLEVGGLYNGMMASDSVKLVAMSGNGDWFEWNLKTFALLGGVVVTASALSMACYKRRADRKEYTDIEYQPLRQ